MCALPVEKACKFCITLNINDQILGWCSHLVYILIKRPNISEQLCWEMSPLADLLTSLNIFALTAAEVWNAACDKMCKLALAPRPSLHSNIHPTFQPRWREEPVCCPAKSMLLTCFDVPFHCSCCDLFVFSPPNRSEDWLYRTVGRWRDGQRQRSSSSELLKNQLNLNTRKIHKKIGLNFYFGGTYLRLRVTSNIRTITEESQTDMTHLLSFFLVLLPREDVRYLSLSLMFCW